MTSRLIAFDAARYLQDAEAVAEYLAAIRETDDPDLLLAALSDVARAKGMTHISEANVGGESL